VSWPSRSWKALSGPPRLHPGEVMVLASSLDVPAAERERLWATLAPDERARASRFRFPVHRDRFVVARGVLRQILGDVVDADPSRLMFEYGRHGKPSLGGAFAGADLRFNVAHSETLAVYAISHGLEVGVDVEWLHPLPDAELLAERFFSAREQDALRSLPAAQRLAAFFACWTRKEAFLKATGEGLSRSLDSFDVAVDPALPARLERVADDACEASLWSLAEIRPATDYLGTVAFAGRARLSCGAWGQRGALEQETGVMKCGVVRSFELEAR
jgi:4'-phosphopantetheinyl transferase